MHLFFVNSWSTQRRWASSPSSHGPWREVGPYWCLSSPLTCPSSRMCQSNPTLHTSVSMLDLSLWHRWQPLNIYIYIYINIHIYLYYIYYILYICFYRVVSVGLVFIFAAAVAATVKGRIYSYSWLLRKIFRKLCGGLNNIENKNK